MGTRGWALLPRLGARGRRTAKGGGNPPSLRLTLRRECRPTSGADPLPLGEDAQRARQAVIPSLPGACPPPPPPPPSPIRRRAARAALPP